MRAQAMTCAASGAKSGPHPATDYPRLTTRSYLFAPTDAHAQTTRLIATAAAMTGFMKGEPGVARDGWYGPGAGNLGLLHQLRDTLAATYPEAGPPFWAVRLWTNLIWQPAYLAVIAVHLHGAVPDLSGLSQQRRGLYIDGFRLDPQPMKSADTVTMIAHAGSQLKTMTDAMLAEVNAVEKLRPLPAKRLLADRMLGLMVWLQQRDRRLSNEEIERFAALWLAQLDLTGQGALQTVEARGHRLVIVQRKGCCLDYLLDPAQLCATCPRQDDAVRVARQTANALAELG